MNRPFWTHLFRPARSKVFGTALVLGASLLAWPASASVPAWLADAAKQPVPAGLPKDTVAVVLYSEQQTTVKPNGETETRYRQACKILRPEGKDYGYVVVFFSKITPIVSFKAWGIPSDGKVYEVKDRDAIETQVNGGEFYDDLKTKILQIPGSDPGNVVGYEYVQKERPYLFLDTWEFQSRIPVMRAVYTLQIPNGWKYDSDWVNYAQSHPQSASENEFSWQVTNVPAIKIEDDMPPWRVVAGRLDVKYFSPADTLQSEQAGSWKDLGLWYSKLTAERRESTPEIQAQVTSLTSNAKTTLDKIEAITSYIQRQIRYVAIEIGIGGWQPHMAGDIFKNQFGDCKDKATLLATMLKDAGIDSYYAVAQIDRGIIQPQFASPGVFNHVILPSAFLAMFRQIIFTPRLTILSLANSSSSIPLISTRPLATCPTPSRTIMCSLSHRMAASSSNCLCYHRRPTVLCAWVSLPLPRKATSPGACERSVGVGPQLIRGRNIFKSHPKIAKKSWINSWEPFSIISSFSRHRSAISLNSIKV